jgi:hypothetical protein
MVVGSEAILERQPNPNPDVDMSLLSAILLYYLSRSSPLIQQPHVKFQHHLRTVAEHWR